MDYSCLITIIYPEPFLWIQKDLVRIIRKLVKYQIYFFSYLTLTSSAAVLKALAHTVSTILTMSCNRLWSSKMAKISWNSPNDNLIATAAASEKKENKVDKESYIHYTKFSIKLAMCITVKWIVCIRLYMLLCMW